MTEPNKERDPIRDIARQLGIQTFGDGLLVKIRETIDCLRSQAQNCAQYREEMEIVQRQLDRFRSQSHGIPALAEIERLRAALRSCAKASSAAEVGLIVDEALAASQAQQALAPENQRVVPVESLLAKPHPFEAMRKRFSDIEDEVARGKHSAMSCFTAMRTAALYTEPNPAQVNRIPAGLYAELEALRTLRDATGVYLQGYMRDEIEDEDSCLSVDQHDAACSVKAALDSSRALEWKGGALVAADKGDQRKLDAVPLYEAVQRAAGSLPEGWVIEINVERDGGGVSLYDPQGLLVDFPSNSERLDYDINDAVDHALEIAQGGDK